jgi:hypothetical protein
MKRAPKLHVLRLDADLDRAVRRAARQQGLTLSAFMRAALRAWVNEYETTSKEKRS